MKPVFQFSNVVVVDDDQIGVIVKTWQSFKSGYNYDIYVRSLNTVLNYKELQIKHFVYSKEISEEEQEFYK